MLALVLSSCCNNGWGYGPGYGYGSPYGRYYNLRQYDQFGYKPTDEGYYTRLRRGQPERKLSEWW